MVREFKKVGVAAAVAGALLASSASYAAVQLSAPGDVMLVPHVLCENADSPDRVNTLIGLITFWKSRIGLVSADDGDYQPAPAALANVVPGSSPGKPARVTKPGGGATGTMHWYFFDRRSNHRLSGVIPVSDNDFVRIDWCNTMTAAGADLDGEPGYMVFVDDSFDTAPSGDAVVPKFALYGHAYMIQGNWASQAFIPVLSNPVCSYDTLTADGDCNDIAGYTLNVTKDAEYPDIARLVSGIDFTFNESGYVRDIYMRYFLDPALSSGNAMVFWFNTNSSGRAAFGETYDSEQVYKNNFSWPLPDELNIVVNYAPGVETGPKFPGMVHEEEEVATGKTVVNTGIVRFGVPTVESDIEYSSSGVAFNLLSLGGGGNANQLQTEMATEGAEYK
jgi:hypothetical protein